MTRRRFWSQPDPPLRSPLERQRLAGWIAMLDVDLDAAQAVLRLPVSQLPLPPIAMPAVLDERGTILAAAVEAPTAEEAVAETVPASTVGLRGAYARRAARRG